jgi:hypothetical protein
MKVWCPSIVAAVAMLATATLAAQQAAGQTQGGLDATGRLIQSQSGRGGGGARPASMREITAATVAVFVKWTDAVAHHAPGEMDEPLRGVEKMTPDDRAELMAGMSLFRGALLKKGARVTNAAQKRVADLAADLSRAPGATIFAERAVLLHGDAAMLAILHPDVVPDSAAPSAPSPPPGAPTAPGQFILERDGEIVGAARGNWNWPFARAMLGLQSPRSDTPFSAVWLHATSTFLVSRRQYGEAQAHLAFALSVVPKDAKILFDRAALAELQGLPKARCCCRRRISLHCGLPSGAA